MAANEFNFSDEGPELKGTIHKARAKGGSDTACANRDLSAGLGVQGRPWVLVVLTAARATETMSLFIQVDQVSPQGKAQTPAMGEPGSLVFCQGIKQRKDPKRVQDSRVWGPALEGMKRNSVSPEKLVCGVGCGIFSAEAPLGP